MATDTSQETDLPEKDSSLGVEMMRRWEAAKIKRDALYVEYQAAAKTADELYQETVRLGREEGWHR